MSDMQIEHTIDGECINLHSDKNISIMANNDEDITIVKNRTINVLDGTHTETIKGDTTIKVTDGKLDHYVAKAVTETFDDTLDTYVKNAISITSETAEVTVNGNGGPGVQIVGIGSVGVEIAGSPNFDAYGESKAIITSPAVDIGNKEILIHGSTSIELVVGGNSIKIDGSGVSINGQKVTISGSTINSSATGTHEITGGMVCIN